MPPGDGGGGGSTTTMSLLRATCQTMSARSRADDPPSAIAALASAASSLALPRLAAAAAPSPISSSTALATSPLRTCTGEFTASTCVTGTFTPARTPAPSTSTARHSLRNWSPKCGHVRSGTPWESDSTVEFQPQWVRKPPTAGCDRMVTCGAHPRMTSPRSATTRASRPAAAAASASVSLVTQMNGRCDASRPAASSAACEHGRRWARVEPRDDARGVDGGAVAARRRGLGVGVEQAKRANRPHVPGAAAEHLRVAADERVLEGGAGVEHQPVGGGLGVERVLPVALQPGPVEEPQRRRPVRRHGARRRQVRHVERLKLSHPAASPSAGPGNSSTETSTARPERAACATAARWRAAMTGVSTTVTRATPPPWPAMRRAMSIIGMTCPCAGSGTSTKWRGAAAMATLSSELAGFRDFMGGEDGDESAMNRKRTGGEIGDDLTAMATATATWIRRRRRGHGCK
uniref:Uncharacterized protein n=1 Tax=Oryza barthii TaxID=65489 RepID=A0A0D3G3U9_9ORYZ